MQPRFALLLYSRIIKFEDKNIVISQMSLSCTIVDRKLFAANRKLVQTTYGWDAGHVGSVDMTRGRCWRSSPSLADGHV